MALHKSNPVGSERFRRKIINQVNFNISNNEIMCMSKYSRNSVFPILDQFPHIITTNFIVAYKMQETHYGLLYIFIPQTISFCLKDPLQRKEEESFIERQKISENSSSNISQKLLVQKETRYILYFSKTAEHNPDNSFYGVIC